MRLEGSQRDPVPGARRARPLDASEPVDVTLVLRRRSPPAEFPDVVRLARLPPSQRAYLSREEFAGRHGAHPDDLTRVTDAVRTAGLTVGSVSVGGRTVHASGPAPVVGRFFGTSLDYWNYPEGTYRGRTGPLTIPDPLAGIVVAVLGLDTRPQARPHFRRHQTQATSDATYTPPTVAAAYDFPPGTDGTGETIAVLELGGGFAPSDLTTYFGQLGVSPGSVSVVSVDGAQNAPTGVPDGPDGEVELDLEVAGSVAPGARLVAYFAPNTDQGFLDGLTAAVHDTTYRPSILSISWGGPESSWTAQARNALNAVCEDAATMGVSLLVAAGDSGASDGVPGGALTVDFPASSPFVTGCGGTRLLLSGGTITSEVVWNELTIGEGATGGGVSAAFPRPSYQSGVSVPAAPNGYAGRGVPDVAGDADPASGYSVRVDGSATVLGGTSAVAPLWAALLARINQSLGVPVGFVNPRLYSPAGAATFHDVTSGNNNGYSAGPGWDPCTGWGSPDGARLLQSLRGAAVPPS
jgi:kumamolisin